MISHLAWTGPPTGHRHTAEQGGDPDAERMENGKGSDQIDAQPSHVAGRISYSGARRSPGHTHTLPRPASLQQGGRSSADGREVGLVRSIASTTGSGAVPFSWSHAHADADAASSSPCRRQRQQFRGHGFFSQIFSS